MAVVSPSRSSPLRLCGLSNLGGGVPDFQTVPKDFGSKPPCVQLSRWMVPPPRFDGPCCSECGVMLPPPREAATAMTTLLSIDGLNFQTASKFVSNPPGVSASRWMIPPPTSMALNQNKAVGSFKLPPLTMLRWRRRRWRSAATGSFFKLHLIIRFEAPLCRFELLDGISHLIQRR